MADNLEVTISIHVSHQYEWRKRADEQISFIAPRELVAGFVKTVNLNDIFKGAMANFVEASAKIDADTAAELAEKTAKAEREAKEQAEREAEAEALLEGATNAQ